MKNNRHVRFKLRLEDCHGSQRTRSHGYHRESAISKERRKGEGGEGLVSGSVRIDGIKMCSSAINTSDDEGCANVPTILEKTTLQ